MVQSEADSVIAALYGAAASEEEWRPALSGAADSLGAADIHYVVFDKNSYAVRFSAGTGRFGETVYDEYFAEWMAIDPRARSTLRLPVGSAFACHLLFDEAFVRHDRFFNEFLAPLGLRWSVCAKLYEDDRTVAVAGVTRRMAEEPYQGEARAAVDRFLGHLGRAARLHERFRALAGMLSATRTIADSLAPALMVLDTAGRQVTANAAAEEILGREDGLLLRDGRLWARDAESRAKLAAVLAQAARGEAGSGPLPVHVERPSPAQPYRLAVWSLPIGQLTALAEGEPRLLVMIRDSDKRSPPAALLMASFHGLTAAETALLERLGAGDSLADLAERRGVRMSTVRSQLSAVLAKTGARNQSDLIRRLYDWPAIRPPTTRPVSRPQPTGSGRGIPARGKNNSGRM